MQHPTSRRTRILMVLAAALTFGSVWSVVNTFDSGDDGLAIPRDPVVDGEVVEDVERTGGSAIAVPEDRDADAVGAGDPLDAPEPAGVPPAAVVAPQAEVTLEPAVATDIDDDGVLETRPQGEPVVAPGQTVEPPAAAAGDVPVQNPEDTRIMPVAPTGNAQGTTGHELSDAPEDQP